MKTEFHTIKLGVTNCFLIRGESTILVESGSQPTAERFFAWLKELGIGSESISTIFLTHGHWDHISGLNAIKEKSGARVAINHHEREWVEKGQMVIPPPTGIWSRFFIKMMKLGTPFIKVTPTAVDISLPDEEQSLVEYGINGTILPTPGHSPGSMSLLLDTGDAFVGDLAMNGPPMRIGAGEPIFADDLHQVRNSWKILIEKGAKRIHPAHGKPFAADILKGLL